MKTRYTYVLLYGVPALLASVIASILFAGAVGGFLWIFVFGDDPWPSSANQLLTAVFVVAWMALWVLLMSIAYAAGKRQEEHAGSSIKHVMVSAGVTAMLVLLVIFHQWSVGNIGTKSEGASCSEMCREKGFASSGTPPKDAGAATCSCFDAQGREALTIPRSGISVERPRPIP
jgi:hypothetical protein